MSGKSSFIPDILITLPAILLISLGVLVIYSSDPRMAVQQAILALIGISIYFILSNFDFESLGPYINYSYIFILLLLIIVFIIGIETRGSLRWISIGFLQIQPSELAKPIVILFLAQFWTSNKTTWKNILKSFLYILPLILLVFKQPDLGTTLTIAFIWIIMLFGANISLLKIVIMASFTFLMAPVFWFFLKSYQKERIATFLSPSADPLGTGYNVIQSMIAVGSGQSFGRGLGRGTQSRLQFLPEFRTDFIFASIAEELGFFGSLIVLSLYGMIFFRSLKIVSIIRNRFQSLIIIGVIGMFFFQVIVNIGMNIGIVPVTGITLPLLSYGGSSLISTLIALSFIASASRFSAKQKFD
ncbi:MAG: rod shape-determining protein RodA [Candidatus Daviesbacteria bacterium]|nr:rod shape-determining protein RodA [Candidatus Daviesbacteria bacterium]